MTKIIIKNNEIPVVVAASESEQEKGLMHIEWPPPCMVFPFKKSVYRKFWMKNTPSPLDIIFCNAGKVVGSFVGEPFSTNLIGPDRPVDLVIELPYGMKSRLKISNGDHISIKYSQDDRKKIIKSLTEEN